MERLTNLGVPVVGRPANRQFAHGLPTRALRPCSSRVATRRRGQRPDLTRSPHTRVGGHTYASWAYRDAPGQAGSLAGLFVAAARRPRAGDAAGGQHRRLRPICHAARGGGRRPSPPAAAGVRGGEEEGRAHTAARAVVPRQLQLHRPGVRGRVGRA
eukprot:3304492-Prymnesium_polylepis.1